MTTRIRFAVYRETWRRGQGSGMLLDALGQRCCLGFPGRHVGIPDSQMDGVALPAGTCFKSNPRFEAWPAALLDGGANSCSCLRIARANDAEGPDGFRESLLTSLFAELGIDIEFKDGAGP